MATSTWTVTTADALSVTKTGVAGSSHFVTGIHVALMSDVDATDVPEAATITLVGGGVTLLNSAVISNTDDLGGYGNAYPLSGYPVVNIEFPHPLKIATNGDVVLTVAGISASLSGDVKKKLTLMGYTEVDKAADEVVSGVDKTFVHVNPGTSDSAWWRS